MCWTAIHRSIHNAYIEHLFKMANSNINRFYPPPSKLYWAQWEGLIGAAAACLMWNSHRSVLH